MNARIRSTLKAITAPSILEKLPRRLRGGKVPSASPGTYVLRSGATYRTGEGVGGMWDEIGQLQFEFLVQQGLQPHHKLLDIGCGSLRGGVHFVKYLRSGNYFGIDRNRRLLDAAREIELPRYNLSNKTVHLVERDDFEFGVFGIEFDYALAQSVFTHLTWNSILRCLVNVEKVLKENGKLYATFFEDEDGSHRIHNITHNPGGVTTSPDKNPFHYEFDVFVDLARRASLHVKYTGEWKHPRNQKMMLFTKPANRKKFVG